MATAPESDAPEKYLSLSRTYIRQAEEELSREDYRQAGEKAWGAVSTAIKGIAEQRGWNHRHHQLTGAALRELADEFGQEYLKYWFYTTESMHNNFYEDTWTEAEVEGGVNTARDLLEALESLRHQPPRPIPNRSNNQKRRWESLNGAPWDDAHPPE
jgi:HEPN domain-containing protein